MAVDKLVDSTQLDADLTSVANAIRTKGGTSAQMAFPTGFVSAVNAIPVAGETPNINGKKFDCGTFTFAEDTNAVQTINHNLGIYPEAIFVWSYNFPKSIEENYAMVGIMKFTNFDDSSGAGYVHTANNTYSFGTTASATACTATTTQITILTTSTYKWRSGYTYHWLAIGGDVT